MKPRILFISFMTIFLVSPPIIGQEKCNHNKVILDFLNKITAPHYKSSLQDYNMFFEGETETEIALRADYINKHPNTTFDYTIDTVSLTINRLINNKTYKDLLAFKNKNSKSWHVIFSHNEGTATLVYKVGVQNTGQYFYFQMVNWPDSKRCKIADIRDSIGNSIIRLNILD